MSIELNISDKVIKLNTYEVEGKTLYKAQDLLKKGLGMTTKQVSKRLENWQNKVSPNSGVYPRNNWF